MTLAVATCLLSPALATAEPVLVLGPHGHARLRQNPYLAGPARPPTPTSSSTARVAGDVTSFHAKRSPRRRPTPASVLGILLAGHQITQAQYTGYRAELGAAATSLRHLTGTRATELGAVMTNLAAIAASRQLTAARLPALFLTLRRNRQWWTTGPLPSAGERVQFNGSRLVWEYYSGQGIELQELASFAEADGLYTAGPAHYAQLEALLGELVPLGVRRGGGIVWEYYFTFDGGVPPWSSAMAQGTAIEALTRAFRASGDRSWLDLAHEALPVLAVGPPQGVALAAAQGTRFLQYSFAPRPDIINAFLQTLIGLYDYAQISGDQTAQSLFAAGDAQALAEVPRFDTGAWSLYQPGVEDSLPYHQLVTGFLSQLCQRTAAPVYCTTASDFNADLTTLPTLSLLGASARVGHSFSLRYRLSKHSHVGVVLLRDGQTVFLTSASFGYGVQSFQIPGLRKPGTYTVHLAATDLAGNFNRIVGTLRIRR